MLQDIMIYCVVPHVLRYCTYCVMRSFLHHLMSTETVHSRGLYKLKYLSPNTKSLKNVQPGTEADLSIISNSDMQNDQRRARRQEI